jgi:hypothetical protein
MHLNHLQQEINNQLNRKDRWKLINLKSSKNQDYSIFCCVFACSTSLSFFLFLSRDSVFVILAHHHPLLLSNAFGYIQWWLFFSFIFSLGVHSLSISGLYSDVVRAHFFSSFSSENKKFRK